jgi:hypothetical protein
VIAAVTFVDHYLVVIGVVAVVGWLMDDIEDKKIN